MEPVDPRINPNLMPAGSRAVVVAEQQAEYLSVPSIRTPDGKIVSRWSLSTEERRKILEGEDIFLSIQTFNSPMQPVFLSVGPIDYSDPEQV